MKYMLLIYGDEKSLTEPEHEQCVAESTELTHELHAKGQYLAASPLQPVATATSVRVRNGRPLVTDGPFAETHEQLGGYFLIEARDLNEAVTIASRIPGARRGTVEIRPVVEACPDCPRSGDIAIADAPYREPTRIPSDASHRSARDRSGAQHYPLRNPADRRSRRHPADGLPGRCGLCARPRP